MKELKGFDPIKRAEEIRPRMINSKNKKVLLASFTGVSQAKDIPMRRIIGDYFRIKIYEKPEEIEKGLHNFRQEPAGIAACRLKQSIQKQSLKRGLLTSPNIKECNGAFIAQINGCNLKCWQCYVDDVNKSANPKYGRFFSAEEILIEFLVESRKAQFLIDPDRKVNILRLSGGDPFLVPEIIVWIIEAAEKFGLENYIYFWVDTNLASGDFYWKYLTNKQREKIRNFKNIGFMGCYKGYDEESFTKTCGAAPKFFNEQFKMHRRLIKEELDVYSYFYPLVYSDYSDRKLRKCLVLFINRLQKEVNLLAPLRLTTPYTKIYSPTQNRLTPERKKSLELQYAATKIWKEEIKKQFGSRADLMPHQIPIK